MSGYSGATEQLDPHEARINRVLTTVYQREAAAQLYRNAPMMVRDIFDQAPGDGDEEMRVKVEAATRLLCFIFQDGPHPGCVMRLVYLMAQRLKPDLILNMNGAELADMFGETRAAWSARNKRLFTRYLKERGAKAAKARMEKSEAHAARCSLAQLGNTHRRGKFKSSSRAAAGAAAG